MVKLTYKKDFEHLLKQLPEDAQLENFPLKERILVIKSEDGMSHNQLSSIRDSIKRLGGLGVIFSNSDCEISSETIDGIIEQLKLMKEKNAAAQG